MTSIPYDREAAAAQEDLARALAHKVLEGRFTERGQAARDLDRMLRQATGVAKAPHVAAYVDMLARDARKIVLCGWHRDVYDIWLARLAHLRPVLYTGTETPKQKRAAKQAFVEGEARLFILSLRSGSGLDGLQEVSNDVVFGELDWSPQVHRQIIGRLRRPPNADQVTAHYLCTDGGSDPGLMETLGIKADQSRGILDPGEAIAPVTRDESRMKRLAELYLKQTDGREKENAWCK